MSQYTTKIPKSSSKCVVGIDEAGRGPLAGPVAVGAVMVSTSFNKKFLKGIQDSKKLTKEERELWFDLAMEEKKVGDLDFAVYLIAPEIIDRKGITYAISQGVKRCLTKLNVPNTSQVFLDGSLKAPTSYKHQLTIIKGDEKIPLISLASILAKVKRDRYMEKKSIEYPEYGFHIHKGYGTLMHRIALKLYGPCSLHRISFLKNFVNKRL